ncbi:MAG: polyamine aminopropyltransferase [Candidatus Sumerlaeia bacterium]
MTDEKNEVIFKGKTLYIEFHDWSEEKGFGNAIVKKRELFAGRTDYQFAQIFDTPTLGRMFTLDNVTMLSTRDEFMYHEMMTHPALFVHPDPRRVLVIGGGDGGSVREVLRHPSVEQCILVEIDSKVISLARKFLPQTARSFGDPRCQVVIGDGIDFVKRHENEFDLIVCDSTDPVGPGTVLFTLSFYRACLRALRRDGIMTAQLGSPFVIGPHVRRSFRRMKRVFPIACLYWAQVPVYADGFYAMAFLSKRFHPRKHFRRDRFRAMKLPLKYYNEEMHTGAFCLPEYVKKLVD